MILGINISFIQYIDKSGKFLSMCILFAIMFTIELFSIVTELLTFNFLLHIHKKLEYKGFLLNGMKIVEDYYAKG